MFCTEKHFLRPITRKLFQMPRFAYKKLYYRTISNGRRKNLILKAKPLVTHTHRITKRARKCKQFALMPKSRLFLVHLKICVFVKFRFFEQMTEQINGNISSCEISTLNIFFSPPRFSGAQQERRQQ